MVLVSNGNRKIGKDTVILNITSAHDCVSDKKGLCKISHKCYAKKAEKQYKAVLPYRRRQEVQWDTMSGQQLAEAINDLVSRKRSPVKYLRFSESGDFRAQKDVNKLIQLAENTDLIVYGYTARSDLDFSKRPSNMIVNGSSFMVDNSFTPITKEEAPNHDLVCGGDCSVCDWCKKAGNDDIRVVIH